MKLNIIARLRPSRHRQRGLTLIETAIVLAIAALMLAFFTRAMSENAEQIRAKGVSDKLVEVHQAARTYLKTYSSALMDATAGGAMLVIPAGRPDPTSAIPSGPNASLPSLQGGGFLGTNFVDRNGYGQRHAMLVRRVTAPATGESRLDAIVTTFGGTPIPDRQLGKIAGYMGAAGGYVPVRANVGAGTNTSTVYGAFGGWQTPIANWAAAGGSRPMSGSVVSTMAFEDSRVLADYLYRNDIGIPEANRMNTNIDMNSHNLNNVTEINGAAGNLAINDNLSVRANISAGIDIWSGGNISAAGNVSATNTVAAGSLVWSGDRVAAGNTVSAGTKVEAPTVAAGSLVWSKDLIAADNTVSAGKLVRSYGDVEASDTIRAAAIDGNMLVIDSSGTRNSRTYRLADLLPKQVGQASFEVWANTVVQKPTCGPGGYAKIMLYKKNDSHSMVPNASGVIDYVDNLYADDYGAVWVVRFYSLWGEAPAASRNAVAQTFCFYQ